jgi:TPR repeat protein
MRELGNIYATGQGVPRDDAKARQWYEQSAAKGSTAAMMALGRLYEEGQGVAVDLAKAREWVQKAADLRFPPAKSWLADHPK